MAEGKHPVPSRTRKLSPPAPMVLPGRLGGRVGRCRDIVENGPRLRAARWFHGTFGARAETPDPAGRPTRRRPRPPSRALPRAAPVDAASRRKTMPARSRRPVGDARPGRGGSGPSSCGDATPGEGAARDGAAKAKALAPRSASVREVLGLALYRLGRYRDALRELQAYRRMTGRRRPEPPHRGQLPGASARRSGPCPAPGGDPGPVPDEAGRGRGGGRLGAGRPRPFRRGAGHSCDRARPATSARRLDASALVRDAATCWSGRDAAGGGRGVPQVVRHDAGGVRRRGAAGRLRLTADPVPGDAAPARLASSLPPVPDEPRRVHSDAGQDLVALDARSRPRRRHRTRRP